LSRNIMVCVTQQKTCERLIRHAEKLRDKPDGDLHVVHVVKNDSNILDNKKEGEALEYLFSISKSVGANLSVLKSDNIAQTLADYATENKINYIVMGQSPDDHKENKFYKRLRNLLEEVEIEVIS
jgi:K+-sensing histidine kinase KdpD